MSNWFVKVIDEFWPCQNGLRIKLSDPKTIEAKLQEWAEESDKYKYTSIYFDETFSDLGFNPNISWNYYVIRKRNYDNVGFGDYTLKEFKFEVQQTLPTLSKLPEVTFKVATNPNTTIEVFEANKDISWNFVGLSENPNFDWKFYCKYEDLGKWDYGYMSRNPNITGKIVRANPDKKWEYAWLSRNPSITWEDVMIEPRRPWDYIECIKTKYINIKNVLTNPENSHERILRIMASWPEVMLYLYLSANPYVTWQDICSHPEKPWNYGSMSSNPNITGEIVEANPDKSWNYKLLSSNPGIKWEYISAHLDRNWDYERILSSNPTLSAADASAAIKYASTNNRINPLAAFAKNKLGFDPYFQSQAYQQPLAKRRHDQIYSELLQRACHPSRSVFSWNEGAAEEYPEQYAEECRRWRDTKFKSQAQQQQQQE